MNKVPGFWEIQIRVSVIEPTPPGIILRIFRFFLAFHFCHIFCFCLFCPCQCVALESFKFRLSTFSITSMAIGKLEV
jgi:hypothetical protein